MKVTYAVTEIKASLGIIEVVFAEFGIKDQEFRKVMSKVEDGDFTDLADAPFVTLIYEGSLVKEIQMEFPEQRMVTLLNTLTPWIKRFCPLFLSIFGMLKVAGNLFMDMAGELKKLEDVWAAEDAKAEEDKKASAKAAEAAASNAS